MKILKNVFILFAVLFIVTACQPRYIFIPSDIINPPAEDNGGKWDDYFEGGDGLSSATAYVISDSNDIQTIRNLIAEGTTDFSGVYFRATDMDLTSGFAPIGTGELPFNGIFEGPSDADRAEIKITVNETDQEYVGLFGGLGEGAIVRYINVSGIVKNETSEGRAGMIAGILGNGALIEYCSAEGSVEATTSKGMAGGIVGKVNAGGTIRNSTNNATVTGSMYAGGIAGAINGDSKEEGQVAGIPIIDGCHNDGAVSSTGSGTVMAGGIVGEARNATISNCYTTESSSVSGSYQVGGIAGQTTGGATIENSENRGKITAPDTVTNPKYIGGISGGLGGNAEIKNSVNYAAINIPTATEIGGVAGNVNSASIINSYNEGAITGTSSIGGIAGSMNNSKYEITEDFTAEVSNNAAITGSASNVGGIIGSISNNSSVTSTDTTKKIINSGTVNSNGNSGGIVGYADNKCTINNVSNEGDVKSATDANSKRAGGIVGVISNSTLINGINDGEVVGHYAGGLVGAITNASSIENSQNTGKVSGTYSGGILGCLWNVSSYFNSVDSTSANIEGTTNHGSVIGHVRGNNLSITLVNCHVDNTLVTDITQEGYIGNGTVKAIYTGHDLKARQIAVEV